MNDTKLLELAAKAAGVVIYKPAEECVVQLNPEHMGGFAIENERGVHSLWNPLRVDGDALRLAVKLGLDVRHQRQSMEVTVGYDSGIGCVSELHEADPYAATRRAIVRAAAELGKAAP